MSKVTTGRLLREMIDLNALTYFPDPAYKTIQFSSYDRRSLAPDAPGWFANADNANTTDRKNYLRDEVRNGRTEHVLADVEGPGALVRFWSANPWVGDDGLLRIYLDDADEPVLEVNMSDLFDGKVEGIPSPLVLRAAGGAGNMYFPIPFAKRCVVTHDADWPGLYYQLNFRCYEDGADVDTFSHEDWNRYGAILDEVRSRLDNPMNMYVQTTDLYPVDVTIGPGFRGDVLNIEGPSAFGVISLRVTAPDIAAALRQTILQVYFDGSPTPQIESPIGDFFGAGPGVAPFVSLPFVVEPDGTMHCRLKMPFAHTARVHLANYGAQTVTVTGQIAETPYEWTERSMHLRAKWRVDHGVEGRPDGYDWPYLILHGSGVWVGTVLSVMNPTPIPTPGGGWWGEGDEKIYLDGESFPSTFGTGSEDYFGYSWSSPDLFEAAYIGQPRCDGPGNRGFTSNYRWHILDALPFARSLEFYMELQTHNPTKGMSYARIGYCYTRPGTRDDHPQLNPSHVVLRRPPAWVVEPAGAATGSDILEAETLEVVSGEVTIEPGTLWSSGNQLRWDAEEGDTLTLAFPVDSACDCRVILCLTIRPGGGACVASVNESEPGPEWSLAHSALTMLREFDLGGSYPLQEGVATLKLRCTDAGSIGIDYIRIAPARR